MHTGDFSDLSMFVGCSGVCTQDQTADMIEYESKVIYN